MEKNSNNGKYIIVSPKLENPNKQRMKKKMGAKKKNTIDSFYSKNYYATNLFKCPYYVFRASDYDSRFQTNNSAHQGRTRDKGNFLLPSTRRGKNIYAACSIFYRRYWLPKAFIMNNNNLKASSTHRHRNTQYPVISVSLFKFRILGIIESRQNRIVCIRFSSESRKQRKTIYFTCCIKIVARVLATMKISRFKRWRKLKI